MRTTFDRIRQAVLFELIGLTLLTLGGVLVTSHGTAAFGVVAIVGSLVATFWNYAYNLMVDRALIRHRGTAVKTPAIRVVHAVGFEAGIFVVLVPFTAWWLSVGLWEAIVLDAGIAAFYVAYAFVFTWVYDRIWPPG